MQPDSRYRHLDEEHIKKTTRDVAARVAQDFPGSGLSSVARELSTIASETGRHIRELRKPRWRLRIGIWSVIVLVLLLALALPVTLNLHNDVSGVLGFMQGVESSINNLVFVSIAIYFLLNVELRAKREATLKSLHELRSIAHVVDMHQLSKDPFYAISGITRTAEDGGQRRLSTGELANYLDLCSELLSMVSKLAALYAHNLNDSTVLGAVGEVEQVCDGLAAKIWQKIMILDVVGHRETGQGL